MVFSCRLLLQKDIISECSSCPSSASTSALVGTGLVWKIVTRQAATVLRNFSVSHVEATHEESVGVGVGGSDKTLSTWCL